MAVYLFAAKALPPTVLYRSYAPAYIDTAVLILQKTT